MGQTKALLSVGRDVGYSFLRDNCESEAQKNVYGRNQGVPPQVRLGAEMALAAAATAGAVYAGYKTYKHVKNSRQQRPRYDDDDDDDY
eukprot:2426694-Rhodomonas_salina.1